MRASSTLAVLAATLSPALAQYRGFNYGATFTNGAAKSQQDFEQEFRAAQALPNTNGAFNSARLFTTVQHGTVNTPISALAAGVSTQTSLLLGLWASAGEEIFNNELAAIRAAIASQGEALRPLLAGISVGSEDLYRISPTGLLNNENPGVGPDVLANYIRRTKETLQGTPWADVPVGHVDTWTAWVNGSNQAVIDAVDWAGVDAYPYFQTTQANGIENGAALFDDAFGATQAAVGGKPVWITETGWPVSGDVSGSAVANVENAQTYYKSTGCKYFGQTNTWWYILLDALPDTPNPSFGVISSLGGQPLFDLSCNAQGNNAQASVSAPPQRQVSSSLSSIIDQATSGASSVVAQATSGASSIANQATSGASSIVSQATSGAGQATQVISSLSSSAASAATGIPVTALPGVPPVNSTSRPIGTGGVSTPVVSPSPTGPVQAAAAAFGIPAIGAAVVAVLAAVAL